MIKVGNVVWLTGCRLSGDVVNLLTFVMISHRFGPAGAGQYAYGFSIATFGFVIGCLGIEEYGLREYSRTPAAQRPAFLSHLLGTQSIMLGVAVLSLLAYLGLTATDPGKLRIVCYLSLYQLTASLVATLFIPAMVAQRMMWPALAELTARVCAASFAAFSIFGLHSSLEGALLGYPLAAGVWLIIAAVALKRFGSGTRLIIQRTRTVGILRILWSFALLEVFAQLFSRVGVIALSLLVGDAAAGYYATGLRLIEVALMPLSFLGVAAYPALSRLYTADPAGFRRSALNLLTAMLMIGALVAWGMYFVAPHLLVPVLGEQFGAAGSVVQLMAVLALVQAVEVGLSRVLLSADRQVGAAVFIAFGAALSLLLNLLWVPRFGAAGAIWAGTAGFVLINILSVRALIAPLSLGALLQLVAGLIISAGAAALAALGLARLDQSSVVQAVVSIVVYLALAGLSYWLHRTRATALDPTAQGVP